MSDHHLNKGHPVDSFEHDELDTRAIRLIRSRTPETVRRRILEQARTLRNSNFAIGIEILPDSMVAVLTDPTGQNFGRRRRDLAADYKAGLTVDTVVRNASEMVRELAATSLGVGLPNRNLAIGLQIGGPVDESRRILLQWRNHPTDRAFAVKPSEWTNPVPLADLVQAETGCATVLENDAAAYAAYELRFGAGYGSFAVILMRDGVGGGIVMDHRVASIPFEIGHLIVQPDGRKCSCDNDGCIEAYAGRRAIRGVIGERLGQHTDTDDIRVAIELGEHNDTVVNAFREGGEAIARGVATVLTLFGIEHVVIYCDPEMCGSNAGKRAVTAFFDGVATYDKHAFATFRKCKIEHKEWHSTDGALGAALVALNQLFFVPLSDVESAS